MTFFIITIGIILAILGIAIFTHFELDDEHYDRLKWVVIRWTYLVTFIGVIVKTFDIAYGVETVTIVAGIGAMLAGLLGISNMGYEERQKIDEVEEEEYIEDEDDDEEDD